MPNTIAIVLAVLVHAWFLADQWSRENRLLPAGLIIFLTARHDLKHREWGFAPRALVPGLVRALAVTLLLGAVLLAVGAGLDTLHDRHDFLGSFAPLIVWGGAQQWVLQTVVLRESQRATSRQTGIRSPLCSSAPSTCPIPSSRQSPSAPVCCGAGCTTVIRTSCPWRFRTRSERWPSSTRSIRTSPDSYDRRSVFEIGRVRLAAG